MTLLCQHQAELLATDTHCHLERLPRPAEVLQRSGAAGVRVIAVTSRPSDFEMLFPLYGRREGVRLALGLHPLDVAHVDLGRELELFGRWVSSTNYIGEVGLDNSPEGRPSRQLQEEAFTSLLSVAGVSGKLLTVHSRGASRRTIELLREAGATRVVLHWFSGSESDARRALDAGFFFSFNPSMIRSRRGQALAATVAPERVLLESDAPYARVSGRATEPIDVLKVGNFLAARWGRSLEGTFELLAANLRVACEGMQSPD